MKLRIEMLRFEQKVIGSITHEAHAIAPVAAAAQGVLDSAELPGSVDGYRIVTETGAEFYGWPGRSQTTTIREG